MKVLISFVSKKEYKNLEGDRLRKCIKGSLELANVQCIDNFIDHFDVMHLISVDEENKISSYNEDNKPVVISCLFSENDPGASYLDFKDRNGVRTYNLSTKAYKILNKVDLILVPNQNAKDFLLDKGINKEIKIISSGVNFARFEYVSKEEKSLFYRYFRENENKKLIIAIGDYNAFDGINSFINAAKENKDALFYFFGTTLTKKAPSKVKKVIKKAPKNTKFVGEVPDDVYKSALLNAVIFMLPSYKPVGNVSILEAMAAKCQIIAREEAIVFSDDIIDSSTGYVAKFSETLTSLVNEFLKEQIIPTTLEAFNKIYEKYNLENIGKTLKNYYIDICNKIKK